MGDANQLFENYKKRGGFKVFVLSSGVSYYYSTGKDSYEVALDRAVRGCKEYAENIAAPEWCEIFAVGDTIVWDMSEAEKEAVIVQYKNATTGAALANAGGLNFSKFVLSDEKRNVRVAGSSQWRPGQPKKSFQIGDNNIVFAYIMISYIPLGSRLTWGWNFYEPSGTKHWSSTKWSRVMDYRTWHSWRTLELESAARFPVGTWRVEFEVNGQVVEESSFEVLEEQ